MGLRKKAKVMRELNGVQSLRKKASYFRYLEQENQETDKQKTAKDTDNIQSEYPSKKT
jgi:hypothetical protein